MPRAGRLVDLRARPSDAEAVHRAQARRDGERAARVAVAHGLARRPAPRGGGRPAPGGRSYRCGRARRRGTPRWRWRSCRRSRSAAWSSSPTAAVTRPSSATPPTARGSPCPSCPAATRDRLGEILPRAERDHQSRGLRRPRRGGAGSRAPRARGLSRRSRDRRRHPRRPFRRLLQDRHRGAGPARAGGGPPRDRGGQGRRQADDPAHDLRRRAPARARGVPPRRDSRVPLARGLGARHGQPVAPPARAGPPRRSAPSPGHARTPRRVAAVLARATGPARRLLLEPDARELLSLYGVARPAASAGGDGGRGGGRGARDWAARWP